MSKILKLLSLQIFLSLLFVSHLEAVKISSQFYKANDIPAECIRQISPEIQKCNMGYDCTIITLKGLPKNKVITIFQKRLSQNKTDELGTLNSGNEGEIEQRVGALWYIPGEPVTFIF